MVEVGSMEIVGLFKDMNLFSSLAKVKTELKTVTEHVKSTTTEMFRMSNQTKMLSGFLGAIGVGGFAALLMTMPRVGTQLEIIHMYLELIALIMDETLGPAMEWVAEKFGDLYHWFKELDPEAQALITWLTVIGGMLLGGLGLAGIIGKFGALKAVIVGIASHISAFVAWLVAGSTAALAFAAVIGALVGVFVVWLMHKTGIMAFISDLGKGFREARENGDILANAITLVLSPLLLLGGIINRIVTGKPWNDFKKDLNIITDSFNNLTSAAKDAFRAIGITKLPFVGEIGAGHAVGGFASYTGLHHLAAGESVGMKGTESAGSFGGGDTTINNNYDGATFVLSNGLDIDDFIELTSRKQAQRASWGAF